MTHGIAFAGRAASGKSTLARAVSMHLWDQRAQLAEVHSFAAALKAEVYRECGITKEMPGGRDALIRYGEERRLADPMYWIDRLRPAIEACWERGAFPLIDDLRFQTEYDFVRDAGFQVVRVHASRERRRQRLLERGEDLSVLDDAGPYEAELEGARFDRHAHTLDARSATWAFALQLPHLTAPLPLLHRP